jgi:hypothetical protein
MARTVHGMLTACQLLLHAVMISLHAHLFCILFQFWYDRYHAAEVLTSILLTTVSWHVCCAGCFRTLFAMP